MVGACCPMTFTSKSDKTGFANFFLSFFLPTVNWTTVVRTGETTHLCGMQGSRLRRGERACHGRGLRIHHGGQGRTTLHAYERVNGNDSEFDFAVFLSSTTKEAGSLAQSRGPRGRCACEGHAGQTGQLLVMCESRSCTTHHVPVTREPDRAIGTSRRKSFSHSALCAKRESALQM